MHFRDASDKRGEGAQDRQETRQGHGFAAMALIEFVGLLQVIAPEDLRVGVAEQAFARCAADDVVGAVAEDRRHH
ncbi:hypothetical protein D3C78_1705710 [compost metagenome]